MCFWTHEKKTFFSLLGTTRNGSVGQGRAFFARREAVGAQRRALTDPGVEGTRPQPHSTALNCTQLHRTALFSTRYRVRPWDASCRSVPDDAAFPRPQACDAHRPRYGTWVRQDNSLQPKEIQQQNPSSASALYVPLPLRRFCTIPFATDPVACATLSGVECHRKPHAQHGGFLGTLAGRGCSKAAPQGRPTALRSRFVTCSGLAPSVEHFQQRQGCHAPQPSSTAR